MAAMLSMAIAVPVTVTVSIPVPNPVPKTVVVTVMLAVVSTVMFNVGWLLRQGRSAIQGDTEGSDNNAGHFHLSHLPFFLNVTVNIAGRN